MDVAGGHADQTEPLGQPLQAAVPRPVALKEGPLELHSKVLPAERLSYPGERGLVMDSPQGTPAEADEPLGMLQDRLQGYVRIRGRPGLLAGVRVGAGQD